MASLHSARLHSAGSQWARSHPSSWLISPMMLMRRPSLAESAASAPSLACRVRFTSTASLAAGGGRGRRGGELGLPGCGKACPLACRPAARQARGRGPRPLTSPSLRVCAQAHLSRPSAAAGSRSVAAQHQRQPCRRKGRTAWRTE